jgi:hypothetical protein
MSFVEKSKSLNPAIWGSHYWFFLHTIAYKYPLSPNAVTKRKYYDLITNFPLFLPDEEIGNHFASLLDKYPVTPYLDNRESFIRWVWFIHNKINRELKKEEMDLFDSLDEYLKKYSVVPPKKGWWLGAVFFAKQHVIFLAVFCLLMIVICIGYLRK